MSETINITPVQLIGPGYEVIIPPDAEKAKVEMVAAAAEISAVSTPLESEKAQFEIRKLAGLRIDVEKSRKLVKAPVIEIGRQIDALATGFLADVTAQEERLKKLVGDHAQAVLRARLEAEAEERRKFEEARKAKEAAERAEREAEEARRKAAEAVGIKEAIEAKRQARLAEQARAETDRVRQEANANRLAQSAVVAETEVSRGVRFVLDFDVVDVAELHREQPDLVDLTVRRRETLAWLKEIETAGEIDLIKLGSYCGLKVTKKPVTSTR